MVQPRNASVEFHRSVSAILVQDACFSDNFFVALYTFPSRLFRPEPRFDFGTGPGSIQRVEKVVQAAVEAGDEIQLRAVWEHLDSVTPRESAEALETNKPIFAGRALGNFLNSKERFAEAEAVLLRVRMWPKGGIAELLEARFSLADAIWGQGDRERAESEALVWIEKLLSGRSSDWPNSKYFARLAEYRYDHEEQARYSEKAFQDAEDAAFQPQIEDNRYNAGLYLDTALAWHCAGRYAPALAALAEINSSRPSSVVRMRALNLEFFMRNSLGDEERVIDVLAKMANVAALEPENVEVQQRLKKVQAQFAHWHGNLDECDLLLDSLGAEADNDLVVTLTTRAETLVLRGEWEKARVVYQQQANLYPVATRYGSRFMALNAMGMGYLELRAHYCGDAAILAHSRENLIHAAVLIRGDRQLSLWVEAILLGIEVKLNDAVHNNGVLLSVESIATQFSEWSDSPNFQTVLAPLLMGTYSSLKDWNRAIHWGQIALSLNHRPVYYMVVAEMLANIYEASGEAGTARQMRQQVVDSGLPITAVALARQQLKGQE